MEKRPITETETQETDKRIETETKISYRGKNKKHHNKFITRIIRDESPYKHKLREDHNTASQ
uniref:Uncharacterized protein n=1 Tax=Rhizophora mucronata TaxID=61149 RepID=A0A2P2K7X0_RHIMU